MSTEYTHLDKSVNTESIPVSVQVETVEFEELTLKEQRLRLHLERKVEGAFYEAAKALMELRDKRLYRNSHKTFEAYCRDRFRFTRMAASQKIAAAIVVENLSTNGLQILPTNERQVRPLIKLKPEQQCCVWQQAVKEAGDKMPSGRIVQGIVQRIMPETNMLNPYRVGEICQIIAKDNPELRGKGGCWCIITQVHGLNCSISVWDGEYIVMIDHLKSLNYSETECKQWSEICTRITKLYNNGSLEKAAYINLKHLGEIKRPFLTPLEEKLLNILEQQYQLSEYQLDSNCL
jgi:hypothetical protein